jgi:hypothetical protein
MENCYTAVLQYTPNQSIENNLAACSTTFNRDISFLPTVHPHVLRASNFHIHFVRGTVFHVKRCRDNSK